MLLTGVSKSVRSVTVSRWQTWQGAKQQIAGAGVMREFNVNEQFKRLELFFEEARQQRQQRNAVFRPEPPKQIKKKVVELVPWPPHMRFD